MRLYRPYIITDLYSKISLRIQEKQTQSVAIQNTKAKHLSWWFLVVRDADVALKKLVADEQGADWTYKIFKWLFHSFHQTFLCVFKSKGIKERVLLTTKQACDWFFKDSATDLFQFDRELWSEWSTFVCTEMKYYKNKNLEKGNLKRYTQKTEKPKPWGLTNRINTERSPTRLDIPANLTKATVERIWGSGRWRGKGKFINILFWVRKKDEAKTEKKRGSFVSLR